MTMKEYEIADPSYGSRRFQWDADRDGKAPEGAELVGEVVDSGAASEDEANPAPAEESQEPENQIVATSGKAQNRPANKAVAGEPANKAD